MSPQNETRLLELLERLVIAVEKSGIGASGAGQSANSGGWRAMKVPSWAPHNKGVPFGDLDEKGLFFWVSKWFPKPFTKTDGSVLPPKSVDVALRKALDQAAKELGMALPDGYEPENAPATKEPAPAPRPAAPPQDNIDEDVPF